MSELEFVSSRNEAHCVNLKDAVLASLAVDGGLYCPKQIKAFNDVSELKNKPFNEVAQAVLKQLNLSAYAKELEASLSAYDEFDNAKPLEFKNINNRCIIELWHGKTRAFKDLALAPMARFISALAGDKKLLIACATSGDTGPATLSAFNGLAKLICIYPEGKTSKAQRAQMIKQEYKNAHIFGIDGNFDDAQSALKELINDANFKAKLASKNLHLCAANSMNFARILYQCIYHFYAAINAKSKYVILVPSGNFGNALGAYYAKLLGAPIKQIRVITNENDVLDEFFKTGVYDLRNRAFKCTLSPAMDILKSSNLERLIYHFAGDKECAKAYESLAKQGYFKLDQSYMNEIAKHFSSARVDDETVLKTIKDIYESSSELIDPHTACAYAASLEGEYIASTAHWSKFAPTIAKALNEDCSDEALFITQKEPNNKLASLIKETKEFAIFCSANELKERISECL